MNTTEKWRDSSRKPPLVPGHGACREVSSPEINRQKGSPPPVPLVLPSTPTHTPVPGNGTGPLMDGRAPCVLQEGSSCVSHEPSGSHTLKHKRMRKGEPENALEILKGFQS